MKNNIPLLGQSVSSYSMNLFSLFSDYIELESSMSGVSFRNSTEEVARLFGREGYSYVFIKEYIKEYENSIYTEYLDTQKE